jgi:hypothetical protein
MDVPTETLVFATRLVLSCIVIADNYSEFSLTVTRLDDILAKVRTSFRMSPIYSL